MTKIDNSRTLYRGRLFEIVQQDVNIGTTIKTFEFARRGPGTRIIVVSDEKQMILTREFRRELNSYDIRLPGGKVFDSLEEFEQARNSESSIETYAEKAAKRELEEETGYAAADLELLGISKCGATIQWDLYYFLCTNWTAPVVAFKPMEDEDISVNWYHFSDAENYCLNGTISEERSAIRILRFLRGVKNGLPS